MTQAGMPHAAYEALQLHPAAPRDLVERVYWHLAAVQQHLPDSRAVTEELQRLNAAYRELVDPTLADQRAPQAAPSVHNKKTPARRRGLWFSAHQRELTEDGRTHHEVLFVAPAAAREIIDLAHDWRISQLKGRRNGDAAEYDLVHQAYAALCGGADTPAQPDAPSEIETLLPAAPDRSTAPAHEAPAPSRENAPDPSAPKIPVLFASPRVNALARAVFGGEHEAATPPHTKTTPAAPKRPVPVAKSLPLGIPPTVVVATAPPFVGTPQAAAPPAPAPVAETHADATPAPPPPAPVGEARPQVDPAPAASPLAPISEARPSVDPAVRRLQELVSNDHATNGAAPSSADANPVSAQKTPPATASIDTPQPASANGAQPDDAAASSAPVVSEPPAPATTAPAASKNIPETASPPQGLVVREHTPVSPPAVDPPRELVPAAQLASQIVSHRKGDAAAASDAAPQSATLSAPATPVEPGRIRTFFSRLRPATATDDWGDPAPKPKSKRELAAQAEHSRLMTLRSDRSHTDDIVPLAEPPVERVPRTTRARLTFIEGLRAGESVPIYDEPMSLGTNPRSGIILPDEHGVIAREHARIWRQGESFLFREVDGEATIVGGTPLTLPVVVLEDDDEIAIGDNIMRFSRAVHTNGDNEASAVPPANTHSA